MYVLGGRGCEKDVFVSSSKFQTNRYMGRQGKSQYRGQGGGGRCVGRSTCPLLAALAETVSSEMVVSPALRGGNWAHRLAVSLILLLFLDEREVAVFPKYRLSRAAGLLGSFSQADPLLFFLQEKHRFSISAFYFPLWNKGKRFKILFQFWLNLFS